MSTFIKPICRDVVKEELGAIEGISLLTVRCTTANNLQSEYFRYNRFGSNSDNLKFMLAKIFILSAIAFLTLYILRGIGMLTFISGGAISLLLMAVIISGLGWGIVKTWRY